MGVHLIPFNDSEHPCQGVAQINALRPPPQPYYVALNFTVMAIVAASFFLSLPVLYVLRGDPRFYKIRPFSVFLVFNLTMTAYAVLALLPESQLAAYPCFLELLIHVAGATVLLTMLFGRTFVFVIESRYHKLLSKAQATMELPDTASDGISTGDGPDHEILTKRHAVKNAFKLGFMLIDLPVLSLVELKNMLNHLPFVLLAVALPPFLVFAIAVGVIPIYRLGCSNCLIFTEFIIVLMVTPSLVTGVVTRYVYLAFQLREVDEQGILGEFQLIMVLGAPMSFLTFLVLFIPDPNDVYLNRVFNPLWLQIGVGGMIMWVVYCLMQIIMAIRFRRAKRLAQASMHESATTDNDFMPALKADQAMKRRFYEFAQARYCTESLNFLEDVSLYKHECDEGQTTKWQRNRARKLVVVYIREGAAQEVNISFNQRRQVLDTNLDRMSGEELSELFTVAFNEILDMTFKGLWMDFKIAERKKEKNTQMTIASLL